MTLQRRIRSLLHKKRWTVYTRKSSTGSKYFHIRKGYRSAIIRIADHPQTRKTKRRFRKKTLALFSFYPGSLDTLNMLVKFLDGTLTIERKKIMSQVALVLDTAFSRQEVSLKDDVMQVLSWAYDTVKNALTKELANTLTLGELMDILDGIYDKYILPINLPGSDILLDPILKKTFLTLGRYIYEQVVTSDE
jgi:hypothetical protein